MTELEQAQQLNEEYERLCQDKDKEIAFLRERLDHDDVIAEVERRNAAGEHMIIVYDRSLGYWVHKHGVASGPHKPTITEAFAAFKAGEAGEGK